MPAFHGISGAVVMDSFSGKGKVSCWKAFNEASDDTLKGLASMSTSDHLSDKAHEAAEHFVCSLYV